MWGVWCVDILLWYGDVGCCKVLGSPEECKWLDICTYTRYNQTTKNVSDLTDIIDLIDLIDLIDQLSFLLFNL